MEKGSGLLVHISSLPSKYGIGTFGKEARKFVRFLNKAGQKYWQILPLNPTSYGDSPYQSFSAFALNPYFIDLDILQKKNYISDEDLIPLKTRKTKFVDYGFIYSTRFDVLRKASKQAYLLEEHKISNFYRFEKKWLEDYALFMTIKGLNDGKSFLEWPRSLRMHKKDALEEIKKNNIDEFKFWIYVQYEAFKQYKALKKYAKHKNVNIIGDIPFYVACDSADVWANSKYFKLNNEHRPTKVAGVPPDYFSENGQLWGNPIYKFDRMKKNNYKWWVQRFKMGMKLYDYIRIDHFRAFSSFYVVNSRALDAKKGIWVKGPGKEFFEEIKKHIPNLKIIAEDLGIIDDNVTKLLNDLKFPGLKVYQFAFEDYEKCLNSKIKFDATNMSKQEVKEAKLTNPFLPHNYNGNCVAYIGTHDNDVLKNFLIEHHEQIPYMMDYLKITNPNDVYDTLIGSLFRANANVTIFTIQDLLKLGKETRMNTPGAKFGNWTFRLLHTYLNNDLAKWLRQMSIESGRL